MYAWNYIAGFLDGSIEEVCVVLIGLVFWTVFIWAAYRTLRWAIASPVLAPVGPTPPRIGPWWHRVHPLVWWLIAFVGLLIVWTS